SVNRSPSRIVVQAIIGDAPTLRAAVARRNGAGASRSSLRRYFSLRQGFKFQFSIHGSDWGCSFRNADHEYASGDPSPQRSWRVAQLIAADFHGGRISKSNFQFMKTIGLFFCETLITNTRTAIPRRYGAGASRSSLRRDFS